MSRTLTAHERETYLPEIKKHLGENSGKSDEDIEKALNAYMENKAQPEPEHYQYMDDNTLTQNIVNDVVSQLRSRYGGRRRSSKSSKKRPTARPRRRSSKARKSRKVRKSRSTRRK